MVISLSLLSSLSEYFSSFAPSAAGDNQLCPWTTAASAVPQLAADKSRAVLTPLLTPKASQANVRGLSTGIPEDRQRVLLLLEAEGDLDGGLLELQGAGQQISGTVQVRGQAPAKIFDGEQRPHRYGSCCFGQMDADEFNSMVKR